MTGALIIGTVALLLSVGSLVWQAYTFRISGSRVTVTGEKGYLVPGATPVLTIKALNRGRSATQVITWWLKLPSGDGLYVSSPRFGSFIVPGKLDAEHEATWYVPTIDLRTEWEKRGQQLTLRPAVKLGSGKTITGKPVTLGPGEVFE